ncbi:hypothetical protein C8R43DRAFT_971441 [Mycena crocata]|nr:hypothetical protein C8R43DRAFT_971441 [Mycena crocata]
MSKPTWQPQRTLAECSAILCGPGALHELETRLIDGRIQRVYKNQWPSLRLFWLWSTNLYGDRTYVVFENKRYTYKDMLARSMKAAAIYSDVYGIKKGDRVGICSRNYPEYLVAFWACHLIGAVAVLANAWLPTPALLHCLSNTQCKLIMLDSERADKLEPMIKKLSADAGANGVVVLESHEGKGHWKGMHPWEDIFKKYKGDPRKVVQHDPKLVPEDNACVYFTSGTTEGVLSTQRQYLTNALNTLVARRRAVLRRGEDIPNPSLEDPQQGILISVPFFHVTTTSLTMTATFGGAKIVLLRKWNPKEAARLIRQEKLTSAGGVPSMSSDLIESELSGSDYPLDSLTFGGAPAPDILTTRARAAFPNVTLSQGYGLTETNSIATSFAGEDYDARPSSCGLPSPVNDVIVVKDGKVVPTGQIGEIWIKGPNIMQEYWRDPSENIDSVSVENALFTEGVMEVAAVAVPDKRLGELVAAVVSVKPEYREKITEESLINLARTRLPSFAVPVMIIFQAELEHNPSGKILKGELRVRARREWEKRGRQSAAKL